MARSFALLVALALGAISCSTSDPSRAATGAPAPPSVTDPRFTRVSAYGVSAEVPGDWVVTPADDEAFATGVSASPAPGRLLPGEQGLLATRVDATQVGAPSDLYYLAAKGPVMARIRANRRCTVTGETVYRRSCARRDHRPRAVPRRLRRIGEGHLLDASREDAVVVFRGRPRLRACASHRDPRLWPLRRHGRDRRRAGLGTRRYSVSSRTSASDSDGVADFVRALAETPV